MRTTAVITLGLALIPALSGCSESCDTVQADIEEIGRKIRNDPETALDRADELDALRRKMEDMGC